ncbi:uncharacterized protein N7515_008660 [Penicillium bovifimosum]|uniref:Myb-like domain-containing protein n=1 Tax=Penicillium bovifimosum TaxID=126998 RepID=A0A9W9GND0_9EURO|nr:uncharacterized protein N7515_008660 [Penicillium bovifimosum]KAJ5124835.1 hypothetical protein N7515_008660 [Penicillium bovifimosum]
MPLLMEDARSTAYAQSVAPFMARPDLNGALSSDGSTYCESDMESFEQFDEPFNTRTVEAHTGLVHPTPKSTALMAGNNLNFLFGTDETSPMSSFGPSDSPMNHQSFSTSPTQMSNTTNYDMGASSFHTHHAPHPLVATPPDAKPLNNHNATSWPLWRTPPTTDIWYPTDDFNHTPDTSNGQNQTQYNAPWSTINNTYTRTEDYNESPTNPYIHNTPMFPSSHPQASLPSSLPVHNPYPPTPSTNVSSPQLPPPTNNKQTSLTPSSLSPTTSSSEPSPHNGEDRSIEASLHYSDERNAFLIDCKRRGLSYKDIKRVGGFKEAESTLRGRYRTLTKSKDQRVRKPKWQEKDIRLLCEAVTLHADKHTYATVGMGMDEPPKVSWKKVAEYIWSRGVRIILGMRLERVFECCGF